MRFKNFNSIYWMLAPIKILSRSEELAFDDCKRILDYLKGSLEQQVFQHHPDQCIVSSSGPSPSSSPLLSPSRSYVSPPSPPGGRRQSDCEGLGSWEEARLPHRGNSTTPRKASHGEEERLRHLDSIRYLGRSI